MTAHLRLLVALAFLPLGLSGAEPKGIDTVPPVKFQGTWSVTKVTWKKRYEHEPDADKITEEKVAEGRVARVHFRRHKTGSLQQFEPSNHTEVVSWSRGITILELTDNTLRYRLWSDHQDMYQQITLTQDGNAVLTIFWPKEIETHYLKRKMGKQRGGGQPATRPESK
ncbi:MAG: hypothetical protein H7Y36_06480 [Armatimonadetes bacterium]|nr:hypothetical protein [Akkermansiaceae bacterium]